MRRLLSLQPAYLLAALLVSLTCLVGCGGGKDTYNPTLDSGGAASFQISVSPASRTIAQGQQTTYTVTVTAQNGFDSVVTPSVSGLPTGALSDFNPLALTPTANGSQTTLTITAAGGQTPTPAGASTLTVSATGGGISRQTNVSLVVTQATSGNGGLNGTIQ
jgi:hypothetical protein